MCDCWSLGRCIATKAILWSALNPIGIAAKYCVCTQRRCSHATSISLSDNMSTVRGQKQINSSMNKNLPKKRRQVKKRLTFTLGRWVWC